MKEVLFIDGTTTSNSIFVTMSCYSYFSLFRTFKDINDAAATSSFRPIITGYHLSFDNFITWNFLCSYD